MKQDKNGAHKVRSDERSQVPCSKSERTLLRRNPRKKNRHGFLETPGLPFLELMREARLPQEAQRAALAAIARAGGRVFNYAGSGLLLVPESELEMQLDLLKILSSYERLRACEAIVEPNYARNPDTNQQAVKDEVEELDEEDEDEDIDDEEEEDEDLED